MTLIERLTLVPWLSLPMIGCGMVRSIRLRNIYETILQPQLKAMQSRLERNGCRRINKQFVI